MPFNIKNSTFKPDYVFDHSYEKYISDSSYITHQDITKPNVIPSKTGDFRYATIDPLYSNVGDIEVDGISIKESLKSINDIKKMLLILERDTVMEERYPELKEAYDNYNKLLKDLQVMEKLADGPENIE